MTSLKKPFYSALIFFGTLIVLTVGYAATTYYTDLPTALSWDTLSSANWNNLVNYANKAVKQETEVLTVTGGNVGIGTVSPGAKLDVTGGNIRNFNGNGGGIDFKRTSDGWNPGSIIVTQDSSYNGTMSFKQNTTNINTDVPTTTMTLYRGNVGIGLTTPSTKLEVSGGSVNIPYRVSYTDGYKLGVGNYHGYIFRNYIAPYHDTMYISTNWTLTDAGVSSVTNAGALTTALGIGANNGAGGFSFKTGGGAGNAPVTRVAMLDNGNVLIGTTTDAGYKLDVNGAVRGTSWANSDRNLKKNIETLSGGLDKILSVRGVRYDWKDSSKGTGSQVGVIAQEVEEVLPELVNTDKQGMKAVNYAGLVAPLIEAVKELKKENDSLKSLLCLDHPDATICK